MAKGYLQLMVQQQKPKIVDIRNISLNTVTLVSIITFFIWLTFWGTNEWSRIGLNEQTLRIIKEEIILIKNELKELQRGKSSDGSRYLTQGDLINFCLRAQLVNDNKWRCPSIKANEVRGFIDGDSMKFLKDTYPFFGHNSEMLRGFQKEQKEKTVEKPSP